MTTVSEIQEKATNGTYTGQYRLYYIQNCSEKSFKDIEKFHTKLHRRPSELKPDHKISDTELKNKSSSACFLNVL